VGRFCHRRDAALANYRLETSEVEEGRLYGGDERRVASLPLGNVTGRPEWAHQELGGPKGLDRDPRRCEY